MKSKRAKANRKTMHLYTSTFKFHQPFQVLVDAEFAVLAASQNLDVQARLEAVMGGLVKPMMTQCTISALYALKTPASQSAIDLSRNLFTRRLCNHWQSSPFPPSTCIRGIIGSSSNPLHYIVATQDPKLRKELREEVPGVPLVYLNKGGVLVLEEEGPASERKRKEMEEGKRHVPQEELEILRAANLPSSTLPSSHQPASAGPSTSADAGLSSGATHDPSSHSRPTANTSTSTVDSANPFATDAANRLDKKLEKARKRNKAFGKKKGGPNPLSVKKKKQKPAQQGKGKGKVKSSASTGAGKASGSAGGSGEKKVKADA